MTASNSRSWIKMSGRRTVLFPTIATVSVRYGGTPPLAAKESIVIGAISSAAKPGLIRLLSRVAKPIISVMRRDACNSLRLEFSSIELSTRYCRLWNQTSRSILNNALAKDSA